ERWYWLRLSLLAPAMVELWHERLERSLPVRLHLGPGEPEHDPALPCAWDFVRGPDAPPPARRHASYAGLATAGAAERFRLRTLTPATFQPALAPEQRATAPRGLTLPLPVPELLLRNLARLWVEWAPPGYRDLAAEPRVAELARHVQL